MNLRVYIISFLLVVAAITLMHYRMKIFNVSLTPTVSVSQWHVEAVVTGESLGKRARIELELPSRSSSTSILQESFSATDLNFAILESDGLRRAVWSGKNVSNAIVQAKYQLVVKPTEAAIIPTKAMKELSEQILKIKKSRADRAAPVLTEIKKSNHHSSKFLDAIVADFKSSSSKLRKAISITNRAPLEFRTRNLGALLAISGFEVVVRKGILASNPERSVSFYYWLQAKDGEAWKDIFLDSFERYQTLIPWGISSKQPLQTEGLNNPALSLSISPLGKDIAALREIRGELSSFWRIISLDTLPVSTQAVYRLILLIPIGGFLVAILRSIVGVRTFGTFMPVLISLSFREMDIVWGVGLFTFVVFCGLFFRALFSNLQLLLVPRLAATLTVVILIVLVAGVVAFDAGYETVLTITLFPIIIITMTVERMSLIWEETGPHEAIVRFVSSLTCAVILYELMFHPYLSYLVFTFPEVLLILLALTLLLGRYTGYRLTELYRFRSFAK